MDKQPTSRKALYSCQVLQIYIYLDLSSQPALILGLNKQNRKEKHNTTRNLDVFCLLVYILYPVYACDLTYLVMLNITNFSTFVSLKIILIESKKNKLNVLIQLKITSLCINFIKKIYLSRGNV